MNGVGYFFAVWLAAGPAIGQAQTSHEQHKPAPEPPRATSEPQRNPAPAMRDQGPYRSAFADYRPFNPAEPIKDWREANEEVRSAGGHVGLSKKGDASPSGHSGHGAPKGRQ